MWEWLMQKTTEIVNIKYRTEIILSTSRDDVVQEVMMYLFEDKELAEKIYKEKSVALLYKIVKTVLYKLESKVFFKNHTEKSRYLLVFKVCTEKGIMPIPKNAYKVAAVLQNDKNISTVSKKKIFTIPMIENMLKLGERSSITECELEEVLECRLAEKIEFGNKR